MDFVSLNGAMVRIDTSELDVFAEIVAAVITEKALFTGHAGFDSDSITGL